MVRQIQGLTDPQLVAYEDRAEAAMRTALQQVMDRIAARVASVQIASGFRELWTGCAYCLNPRHPGPCARPGSKAHHKRHGKTTQDGASGGPGSGTDLIAAGDAHSVAAAVDADAAATAFYPDGGNRFGPHGDEQLHAIATRQGFDGQPQVVSGGELDAAIAGGAPEMFRGSRSSFIVDPNNQDKDIEISGPQIQEQLRSGPVFYGEGIFGNGIYTSPSRRRAESYAAWEDEPVVPGSIARMALHPKAKTLRLDQGYEGSTFEQEHRDFMSHLQPGSDEYRVFSDPGRYAAARGFDALHIEYPGKPLATEFVVFNRSALLVQEADAGVS